MASFPKVAGWQKSQSLIYNDDTVSYHKAVWFIQTQSCRECEWFRIHGKLEWSGSRSCPCIEYIHWYKQPFMCLQLWCSIDRYGLIIRWSLGKRMWCPSWKKFFWQHCLIQRSSLLLRRMYISVTDKKKSTLVETP